MTVAEASLVALYAVWCTAILLRQFRGRTNRAIAARDPLRLVPNFGLFGGVQPREYRFDVRTVRTDGTWSDWSSMHIPPRPRLAGVWHPQLIHRHLLLTFADRLAALDAAAHHDRAERSPQYRAFVSWLCLRVAAADDARIQFTVFAYRAYAPAYPATLVFVSNLHDVHAGTRDSASVV